MGLTGYSQKTKQEYKNSKQLEKLDISIKNNYTRIVFNMIWLLATTKIHPEEQFLTEYCVAQNMRLLVIHIMIYINVELYQFFASSLIKRSRDTIAHTRAGIISEDQKLANELHKPITRKFQKHKVHYLNNVKILMLILQTCS